VLVRGARALGKNMGKVEEEEGVSTFPNKEIERRWTICRDLMEPDPEEWVLWLEEVGGFVIPRMPE
jgi:hypothetical protein